MKPPPVDFMPLVNELRIRGEVLKNERAEYGEQMVSTLSAQLAVESASGWRSVTRQNGRMEPTWSDCRHTSRARSGWEITKPSESRKN